MIEKKINLESQIILIKNYITAIIIMNNRYSNLFPKLKGIKLNQKCAGNKNTIFIEFAFII